MKARIMTLMVSAAIACCGIQAQQSKQHNFATATRAFYLWRCGTAVECDYDGNHYATKACHLNDGLTDYIGEAGGKKDGTGGWHDAGDYGKYTVNAGVTLGTLFYAWDHFEKAIRRVKLNLPVTAKGYPEFLEELKWETDFILKMQYPDGSGRVSHKLTRKEFSGFIMPQEDDGNRYYTEWSSAATADFVAMMAMAARYFKPYDKAYAQKCLDAATLSYKYLQEHPEDKRFQQGDFSTGGYQTTDPDDRLWAAAEMWETTGNTEALKDIESRIQRKRGMLVNNNWDWGSVDNLGVWTYALSKRQGRDAALLARVNEAIMKDAEILSDRIMKDQYGCPLSNYFWGCNGLAARNAVNLHVAEIISGGKVNYKESISRISKYLLGNNGYNRSFITGLGINPPMHPHDRRSGADGIEAPWPGYLVGGGHSATDWVDDQDDYSRNEIAINWQAGLVYLFAAEL